MKRSAALLFVLLSTGVLSAEEWPGWRGPRGDGTSTETGIPRHWNQTENVVWKTPLPGLGHSSPIVWGDSVFVTSCVEQDRGGHDGNRMLFRLDRNTGKILWQRIVVAGSLERKHDRNSFASGTPATDGTFVYVAFLEAPNVRVVAYDFDGNEVWRVSPGIFTSVHGFCTSPVLHKDLVILNCDHDAAKGAPPSYVVALDRHTGKEVWRTERPNRTRSYCTPILIQSRKKPNVTQLVFSGSKCVTSYDADTGKLIWMLDGPTEQYVASLVYHDDVLFLTTGFPEYHLMGLSPDGEGKINNTEFVRWHIPHKDNGVKGASYVPSPIAFEHHFFVVSDVGYLSCIEAASGKRLWMQQLGKRHGASPVLIDGYFYFPDYDNEGVTWVLKAGTTFEVVAKNPLGEPIHASPAVSHGQLFLRGEKHLFCIGSKKE